MKNTFVRLFLVLATISLLRLQVHAQAHQHINVAAQSKAQGSKLIFTEAVTLGTNSGTFLYLTLGDPLYPNHYQNAATFTSSAGTIWTGGPIANSAALGSYIEVEVLTLDGPAGGEIGFWEEADDGSSTTQVIAVPVGQRNGTNRFNVSAGFVDPDSGKKDPFGHLHNRRFTATKPGLYTVSFRAIDTSNAGADGGPTHSPSDVLTMYFQAGLTLNIKQTPTETILTYPAIARHFVYLDASTNLVEGNWKTITAFAPDNHSDFHVTNDPIDPAVPHKFYRLRLVPSF
jgi:hypothetical protein